MIYSVRDLPATYTVHRAAVLSFMSVWVASCEGTTIAICLDKIEADQECRKHAILQGQYV